MYITEMHHLTYHRVLRNQVGQLFQGVYTRPEVLPVTVHLSDQNSPLLLESSYRRDFVKRFFLVLKSTASEMHLRIIVSTIALHRHHGTVHIFILN